MITIEPDPPDLAQEPRFSFPKSLDNGVGSFRNFRVRDAGRAWVARVGRGDEGWLEGAFDIEVPGLVVVCGAGRSHLVSTSDPDASIELPVMPVVGIHRGSRQLACVLHSFTDLIGVRPDGSWWIVRDVSADGIRGVRVKREVVDLEVWMPERQAWTARRVSVVTGGPPQSSQP